MQDQGSNNRPDSNTGSNDQRPEYMDWREQRRDERRARRSRDPLRGLFWGLLLILLGALFLIGEQQGIGWDILWKYLLIGLGAIFIIDGLAHFWSPAYREGNWGRFIPGVVLLFVGIAFLFNFSQWWPIILIAVGVVILLSYFFRRNR